MSSSRTHVGAWFGIAGVMALVPACTTSTDPEEDGGRTSVARDAELPEPSTRDAQVPRTDAAITTMPPGFIPPIVVPSSICALSVGAECDGAEDCGDGQVCCGEFEPERFRYTRIACADRCEGLNSFALCHAGESCSVAGQVCRRSLIIPFDFIGVCAPPIEAPALASVAAVPDVIACGQRTCEAGVSKCCLRTRFDFAPRLPVALEPYCAPLDDSCGCDHVPPPITDDEDAGG
jgi:hypothetical protein